MVKASRPYGLIGMFHVAQQNEDTSTSVAVKGHCSATDDLTVRVPYPRTIVTASDGGGKRTV